MRKPDVSKTWYETYVEIGPVNRLTLKMFQNAMRTKICHVSELLKTGEIDWYQFLFHENPHDPNNAYFHIRFTTDRSIEIHSSFPPDFFGFLLVRAHGPKRLN